MEMIGGIIWTTGLAGESYESVGSACWRQPRSVEICGQKRIDRSTKRSDRANKRSRLHGQHLCPVKSERLRTEVTRAGGVEDGHAHVISIGPSARLRVIKELRPKLNSVMLTITRCI